MDSLNSEQIALRLYRAVIPSRESMYFCRGIKAKARRKYGPAEGKSETEERTGRS